MKNKIELIDKARIIEEIEKRIREISNSANDNETYRLFCGAKCEILLSIISFINTLEVKEVDSDRKTDWCPSNKQIKSLHDLLKYNIGVFDYQKFMDVQALYDDLTKIFNYETD